MAASLQRIVYVLKNAENPPRYYTGLTADLRVRLDAHNAGRCPHTARYRPWAVDVLVKFADETRALKFEKYLKSGSGAEFARRHLR
jgi:predicted GIY-YIG superfamily endonuclease